MNEAREKNGKGRKEKGDTHILHKQHINKMVNIYHQKVNAFLQAWSESQKERKSKGENKNNICACTYVCTKIKNVYLRVCLHGALDKVAVLGIGEVTDVNHPHQHADHSNDL